MNIETEGKSRRMGNNARVRRYRARHRRIDYVPSPTALAAIEKHKGHCRVLAGIIDHLILTGDKAISGN